MLYEAILSHLAGSAQTKEGDIYYVVPRTSQGLQRITGFLCASMTAPHGPRCVEALESFWSSTFQGVENIEYPESLKEAVKALKAVGLELETSGWTASQSQSQSQLGGMVSLPG